MDSIKLIEETSFNEKQKKNLRRIEKERDRENFVFSSNMINPEKNRKSYLNNNYNNNINASNNARIYKDNQLRGSSDKVSDLMYNLYPENSFKFQKSNYKKHVQNHSSSSKVVFNNLNNIHNMNNFKLNMNISGNGGQSSNEANYNNDVGSLNEEKYRNLFSKLKK